MAEPREKLPPGLYASRVSGQRGTLYEFSVDNTIGAVMDILNRSEGAGVSLNQGVVTEVQSWDREEALAAYKILKDGGCRIVGA